jgi:sodium/bile acid cotransporter 7
LTSDIKHLLKRYWFLLGLVLLFVIIVVDTTETMAGMGRWLKTHYGPEIGIIIIFLFSGMLLDAGQIRSGLKDVTGTSLALFTIFIAAPLIAAAFSLIPMDVGIIIGIFIVAVMPTTLSSGVVMTGASGGNMAHALFITITANSLAIFTIPISLSLLLNLFGGHTEIVIDKVAMMIKLGCFVLLPLSAGILIKQFTQEVLKPWKPFLQTCNQCLILCMVWMGLSQSRQAMIDGGWLVFLIIFLVFIYHALLLLTAGGVIRLFKLGRGRRESVIFMGAQKTLPLAIILQVTLFPEYGAALVVCVSHHIIHLMMDGYLVGRLRS